MQLTAKAGIITICAAYLILAITYSIVTPIFEASDELWHYPMVKVIADTGQLPIQDPVIARAWRQEGSQPPLYYMATALLTSWIDTSDMDHVRRQNPHADIGLVLPDGNVNMITHRSAEPWQGTVLAVHMARFFSIALGLGTVWVSYALAREIFPQHPVIHLGTAALVAFLPMFLFISGSVNNDNLSNLLGNLLLLLITRLIKFDRLPHWQDYALIGIATGAGLLSKLNIGFMIPLVALALAILSFRLKSWRPFIIGGFISGGLTVAVAGWWYWRNYQLYGDPTGLNVFLQIVGRRMVQANLPQLWAERHSFSQAYWGFFGGVNVPLPEIIYLIFNIIAVTSLISAATFLLLKLARRHSGLHIAGWLPASFTLIWPVLTFISYLRWTAETPASQGRLIFGALAPISMWMIVGLVWWLPTRIRLIPVFTIATFFAAVAVLTPFMVIVPAYREPAVLTHNNETSIATFGDSLELLEAQVTTDTVQPEGFVSMETIWRVSQPMNRNWSLFVHLVTSDGVIISQRDIYPAQGLLATADLSEGRLFSNPVSIRVPRTANAPALLDVHVGWYHLPTGERLMLENGSDTLIIGQVQLNARSGELPNPVTINFGDLIMLDGYAISDLSPTAGDAVEITLHWRGLTAIEEDYKVFVNIINPQTLTKYAASDGMPANWTAPTSTWEPGEIIEDTHLLNVDPSAPPGIYEVELGLYREAETGLQRLRIHTPDGGQADNYLYLTRVRILPDGGASG